VPTNGDTIKLDQFLKFMNLASTGGQAKQLVQYGHVEVNGVVETRRGRKLRDGDTVTVDQRTITVDLERLGREANQGQRGTSPAATAGQSPATTTDHPPETAAGDQPTPGTTPPPNLMPRTPDERWEDPDRVARFAEMDPDLRLVELLEQYPRPAGIRVLDLGCAGGRNSVALVEHGCDLMALDASQAMVTKTRERLAQLIGAVEAERRVRLGRMDELSWATDASFDLVVAFGILHEAQDDAEWERSLTEVVRVLRPGGRLLLSTLSPGTIINGEQLAPAAGSRRLHVTPGGVAKCLLEPSALDGEMAVRGLLPVVPTTTVQRDMEDGHRITTKALYSKG